MPEIIPSPDPDYLMDLLKKIISFKTVAPPGSNYQEIVDWLVPIFREMGFATQKMVMPEDVFAAKCSDPRLVGDRFNLRADLSVGAEKTLVIYAHLDVVPAEGNWDSDPFQVVQKNGRAYGRGVSDCKGSIAALIAALKALLESGKPKYNLSVLLTTDEEVGGYSGLCYLTDLGQVKGDLMLCMDGFSDDVVIGSNGIITWDVVVHGRSVAQWLQFPGDKCRGEIDTRHGCAHGSQEGRAGQAISSACQHRPGSYGQEEPHAHTQYYYDQRGHQGEHCAGQVHSARRPAGDTGREHG